MAQDHLKNYRYGAMKMKATSGLAVGMQSIRRNVIFSGTGPEMTPNSARVKIPEATSQKHGIVAWIVRARISFAWEAFVTSDMFNALLARMLRVWNEFFSLNDYDSETNSIAEVMNEDVDWNTGQSHVDDSGQ